MVSRSHELELVFCHYERNDAFAPYRAGEELILPRNPLAASARLRRAGLDLVHYNPLTVYAPLFVGQRREGDAGGRRAPVPRVATIHGAAPLFLPEQYSRVKVLHERYAVGWLARRMDHIFAVSETTKRFIVDTYHVPAERIDVIYNAVDPGFRRLPPAEREQSRVAGLRPFVLHLSKFSERKNPWTILDAFAELATEDRELKLVLAGAGWDNDAVRRNLRENEIEAQVVFPGFVEKEEIVELMNLAEVFVFPSFYEGFGMPNLEAMACGCPVVTSRAFAIPEIVGDAAITLRCTDDASELASRIREIRTDDELRRTLTERGVARAAAFSWHRSIETIFGAYRRLLEAG